jgi:HlyD family secretion protein
MKGKKFFSILGAAFLVALIIYLLTTPKGNDIQLIGIVDGNEVIVSPQITGRIVKLTVDEGSEVKKGQLIAEMDRAELEAEVASDEANIQSLVARVEEQKHNLTWMDGQTLSSVAQSQAGLTSAQAQLDEARADLRRDDLNTGRTVRLFGAGVVSVQDRDTAVATLDASRAHVKSLEDQVKAQRANVGVNQANRRQVDISRSEVTSLEAQVEQARATKAEAETRLGYTEVLAPIDGIVSVRVAKQGEVVSEGSPIVVVVDMDHLWVQADVEESYIDSINFGQHLKVRLPSGEMLDGTVYFKGVESDFATQRDVSRTKRDIKTFAIKVAIPNPQRTLFTGMTATVLLPTPHARGKWFSWPWRKES